MQTVYLEKTKPLFVLGFSYLFLQISLFKFIYQFNICDKKKFMRTITMISFLFLSKVDVKVMLQSIVVEHNSLKRWILKTDEKKKLPTSLA